MKKISILFLSLFCFALPGLYAHAEGREMRFASGARITLPEGVEGVQKGDHMTFSIEKEDLNLQLIEFHEGLDESLKKAQKSLYPRDLRKPVQSMKLPELEWAAVRVDTYAPDQAGRVISLIGKTTGTKTWVLASNGIQGVLEKRAAQILTLVGSLKFPGQKSIDLSTIEPDSLSKKEKELEHFIQKAMSQAQVPGLAIAVVEDGELTYTQGFGFSSLENQTHVDADTRFMIGSITKSMTTFLISKLVDEEHLHWEDKVVSLDPAFRLKDPQLSKDLKLEDLACACTGIPRHDLPLALNHKGRHASDLMQDLSYLEQTTKFGETFQYNNQMVAASGYVAAKKLRPDLELSQAYKALMKHYVFQPMNMERTTADPDDATSSGNFATPYLRNFEDALEAVDLNDERFADFAGPSGGIWSSVSDMSKYAITELNKGINAQGQTVISEESLMRRRKERVRIDKDHHYGLGWVVGKDIGLETVQHSGGTHAFASLVTLYPSTKNAIVILTNNISGAFIEKAIRQKILEIWYGKNLKSEDMLTSSLQDLETSIATLKKNLFELSDPIMKPYLGSHVHNEIGTLSIGSDENGFYIMVAGSRLALTGHRDDTGTTLMIKDLPLLGLSIEPVFKDGISIQMKSAQEVYRFHSTKTCSIRQ